MKMSIAHRGVAFCPLMKIPPVSYSAAEETTYFKKIAFHMDGCIKDISIGLEEVVS